MSRILILHIELTFICTAVISQSFVCIWGGDGPVHAELVGLYAFQGDHNSKAYYKKSAGTCRSAYYIYYSNAFSNWHIHNVIDDTDASASCSATDLMDCNLWTHDEYDPNVFIILDSCPSWHCDQIWIPSLPLNCDCIFDLSLGNNIWSTSSITRYWFFNPMYGVWICDDKHPGDFCGDINFFLVYTQQQGWNALQNGQSITKDMVRYSYPSSAPYTIHCMFAPSMDPTESPLVTVAPSMDPTESPLVTITLYKQPSTPYPTVDPSIEYTTTRDLTTTHDDDTMATKGSFPSSHAPTVFKSIYTTSVTNDGASAVFTSQEAEDINRSSSTSNNGLLFVISAIISVLMAIVLFVLFYLKNESSDSDKKALSAEQQIATNIGLDPMRVNSEDKITEEGPHPQQIEIEGYIAHLRRSVKQDAVHVDETSGEQTKGQFTEFAPDIDGNA